MLGAKTISYTLDITRSSFQSIIWAWKEDAATAEALCETLGEAPSCHGVAVLQQGEESRLEFIDLFRYYCKTGYKGWKSKQSIHFSQKENFETIFSYFQSPELFLLQVKNVLYCLIKNISTSLKAALPTLKGVMKNDKNLVCNHIKQMWSGTHLIHLHRGVPKAH